MAADAMDLPSIAIRRRVSALRIARRNLTGTSAILLLVLLIGSGILAPLIAPYDPVAIHLGHRLEPPSGTFWFGTDSVTRDVFSRVLYAMRYSFLISMAGVAAGLAVGGLVGVLTGYVGSWLDIVVQRFVDVLQSMPGLILALVVVSLVGRGHVVTSVVIALVVFPSITRVIRSAVLQIRALPYIEAAAVVGCPPRRIILRHVLPNIIAPVTVVAALGLSTAILVEAGMSFLGLGLQPPNPSLGGMLSADGRTFLEQRPTLALFPGLAISLFILAANLLGDSLRDLLDPRLRGL